MTAYPLSAPQQAIWFEEQLQRGTGNTGFFSVTLIGDVDEAHVATACEAVVRRHQPIRTIVRMAGDQPLLEVQPEDTPLVYSTADVPCAPGAEVDTARSWRDLGGKRRFALTREVSIAFTLLRHGPGRRTLVVVAHHLCYDGRSKFVFARDFAAALTALRTEGPAALRVDVLAALPPAPWPALPEATDDECARAIEFWRARDLATHEPLRLPRGTPTSPAAGTIGERSVDGEIRGRLVEQAKAAGTNLFGAVLASLALTLYGYGNTRLVLCAPVDISTPQTRDLIGLAVNVVPMALTVDGDDTFQTVLGKAHAARQHLKDFRLVPFQRLGVGGARALFSRISLSYMRMATDVPGVPGLETRWNFLGHNHAQTFDLMLHVRDAYDRIVLRLDFSGHEVDAATATTVAEHLRAVMAQAVTLPATRLRDLALYPADGSVTVRATGAEPPSLAAVCAAQDPDRVAVCGPDGPVTFRELALDRLGPLPDGRLAAALDWQSRRLDLPAGTRTLALAPPGSVEYWQERWLTWAAGGVLVVAAGPVAETVAAQGITTIVASYPVLRAVAGLPLSDVLTPMAPFRPTPELVALVRSGVRLHTQYLPAGVGLVAQHRCALPDLIRGYGPRLQQIVDGTRISVCGPDGRLLPRGLAGRLVVDIEGPGGTWARHDTGDLAEVDRAGAVYFLGAAEETVAIAGQSLHLPAVERFLAMHPKVAEAVVVARGNRPAAFLVPREGSDLDLREARLYLRTRSVPGEPRVAEVHVVPDLPRLPSGAVDRTAVGR